MISLRLESEIRDAQEAVEAAGLRLRELLQRRAALAKVTLADFERARGVLRGFGRGGDAADSVVSAGADCGSVVVVRSAAEVVAMRARLVPVGASDRAGNLCAGGAA